MTDFNILLIIVFVSITGAIWLAVNLSSQAFNVYQNVFTSRTEIKFEKMFMFFDIKKMFFTNLAMLVGVPLVVYVASGNLFYTGISFLVVIFMPRILLKYLHAQRKKKFSEALPDALAQIAGSMRSGSTFTSSLELMVNETKGPISQEFGLLLKEQKIGISQEDAFENLGERVNLEDVDLIITAALIARDVGGNLAETYERLSVLLRRKIEMEGKIKALTAQGKMQGVVVAALPFAIILALVYVEPEGINPIFNTYLGWMFLAVILILELMGGLLIRKIVTIDV